MKMLGGKKVDKLAGASFVDSYSLVHSKNGEILLLKSSPSVDIFFFGDNFEFEILFLGLQIPEAAHASCHFFSAPPKGLPWHPTAQALPPRAQRCCRLGVTSLSCSAKLGEGPTGGARWSLGVL